MPSRTSALFAAAIPAAAVMLAASTGPPGTDLDTYDLRFAERASQIVMFFEADEEETAPDPTPHTFATVEGAELVTPSAVPLLVGFHQAAGPSPLPLEPVGDNVSAEDAIAGDGEVYAVLPSRGRGTHPASAVDIVVPPGTEILAPVSGTVAAVSRYQLYGGTSDVVVVIGPDDAEGLLVKVLHVKGVAVAQGDTVVAGESVIAAEGRPLPFASQVDRFVGERLPHVHIEVVRG
jgi:murein DD-endopeptidase MepM/ murein hydrolase activator NlpD